MLSQLRLKCSGVEGSGSAAFFLDVEGSGSTAFFVPRIADQPLLFLSKLRPGTPALSVRNALCLEGAPPNMHRYYLLLGRARASRHQICLVTLLVFITYTLLCLF